ncbi:MAG: cbb3-type cytochrome c oxidase subunit II [Verrucomicrobia bacterium]|jgi:cbb3-type cytochrome oxidase cytochrome c subunit|nr:cbb3-type cytochrome c oxidase subunit II [Verrucomicrobiota bacterium]
MKHAGMLFLTGFVALSASWAGFILVPQLQIGRASLGMVTGGSDLYPQPRPGLAAQGAQVYRANGCYHCHSRQVRQEGAAMDVILASAGTNQAQVLSAFKLLDLSLADNPLVGLPRDLLVDVDKSRADFAQKTLEDAGAKAMIRIRATGSDIKRGWGQRGSVARDYLQDQPILLGWQRLGPDLANIGVRQPDPVWHLKHLYAPDKVVERSSMPPYRFLFEKRKIRQTPSPDALVLEGDLAPEPGFEIVPTGEAKALVAYLLSLKTDVPLFEAPFSAPAPAAVPVASATNATPVP